MTAAVGTPALPPDVAEVVAMLATLPGTVAVALGGSRAAGGADAGSDWDVAVYYRGALGLDALAARGEVHPPGAWGRIMNGGAWLRVGDLVVDVLLRDLDVVLHWTARAEAGEWELDALLGYAAGLPTYSLAAELASGRVLAGTLPVVGPMPALLRETAPPRWRFCRDFSLEYARMHAARGNVVGAVAQAARAAMEEAHARACERGLWTLNEKRLLALTGVAGLDALFAAPPAVGGDWERWLDAVGHALAP
ncbi:MAG: nucleotidyltransferase domain-containing protein [Gemmatimonadales bacterium]|nr:nucleotidyltransferase domain-containing protein [Gemmatimonadales bacterium]